MLPGNTLRNRYKIVKLLGSGSFGITYLAQDLDLPDHPLCVVKNLRQSQTPEELQDFVVFFNREAKALYRLGNECDQIPRLFAHFEENGEFYLVQEYIDGHDLSQEIYAGNQLSEAKVTQLLQDILEVLTFIHDRNIIHRDVKAQNLMRRNRDGKIILIDFGTVKELSKLKANPQELTNASVIVGTSGYMPSEQLNGYPKLSSDVYAVGMLGIYALTGIRPQDLPRNPETFEVVWQNRVSVSPNLAIVLDKMVCSNFRERYQNASEALQALIPPSEPTANTLRVAPGNLPVSSPPSSVAVKQKYFIILASVFSLIFGIGLLFMVFNKKPESVIVDSQTTNSPTVDSLTVDAQTCLEKINSISTTTELPDYENEGIKLFKLLNGDITNGKLNGCGILKYKNNNEYQGIFKESKLNGRGILIFADDSKYYGEFKENQRHGEGILIFASQDKYQGEFKQGLFDGKGTFISKVDKYRYIGEFSQHQKYGEGELIYDNGCRYKGGFKNDVFHGQGTCIDQNGISKSGTWVKGILKGENQTCCNS